MLKLTRKKYLEYFDLAEKLAYGKNSLSEDPETLYGQALALGAVCCVLYAEVRPEDRPKYFCDILTKLYLDAYFELKKISPLKKADMDRKIMFGARVI